MKTQSMFTRMLCVVLVLLLTAFVGCGQEAPAQPEQTEPVTVPDTATEAATEAVNEEMMEEVTEEEAPVLSWQQTYADLLVKTKDTYGELTEYWLYDIDVDGTPELFVQEGTSEADYTIKIYSDTQAVGSFDGGHTVVCATKEPGTFLRYFALQGYERVWLCTWENGVLREKEIYFCNSVHVSEYLPLHSVQRFNLQEPVRLQWDGNEDIDGLAIVEQAKQAEADAAAQLLGSEELARLTGICSALYDTNCSMGGHEGLSADVAEDRLIFVFAHLLAGDDVMPDAPKFVIDNRPEGRICTIGKADMDRLCIYFFGSPLEHGDSASWALSHNITVLYENGMYTYDSPPGDFGATTGVAVITNMVRGSYGGYTLTLAGFATRPGMTSDVDYADLTLAQLSESSDFEFYKYLTATVAQQDGQYVVTDIHFAV